MKALANAETAQRPSRGMDRGRHAVAGVRSQAQAGFSLVEILVALTITVIGLVGLMSLHAAMIRGNREDVRFADATTLAQRALEELRALPIVDNDPSSIGPDNIQARFGNLPIADVIYDKTVSDSGVTYLLRLSATPISGTLVRLGMRVEWLANGEDPEGATVAPEERHSISVEMIRSTLEML